MTLNNSRPDSLKTYDDDGDVQDNTAMSITITVCGYNNIRPFRPSGYYLYHYV